MNSLEISSILENIYDGVYYVDSNKKIIYWNKAAERITGFSSEEVAGHCCADNILRHIDKDGNELCIQGCPLGETLKDGKKRDAVVYLHHKNGHRVKVKIRVIVVHDEFGKIKGALEIFSDISTREDFIDELEKLKKAIYKDALTQAGNRSYGDFLLKSLIVNQSRSKLRFGIIFLDIDYFKRVNDDFGHTAGDQILQMISHTVNSILRTNDAVIRWGGEEFLILIPNIAPDYLNELSNRIRIFVEKSFIIYDNSKIEVTISLGATISKDDDTPETIIERADKLMYKSKNSGRNRVSSDIF